MKIIYEYGDSSYGLVVIEQEPQKRTVWLGSPRQLNFPYVINIITYDKLSNGKVCYGGIYKTGLIVLLANQSIKSLDDMVYVCPTEAGRHGLVCTPHEYDNKQFDTLNELLFFVTSLWWQIHHGDVVGDWRKETTESVLKKDWGRSLTLREAIEADYPGTVGYGRCKTDSRKSSIAIPKTDKDVIYKPLKVEIKINLQSLSAVV